jgi:hypothetical protein
MMNQYIVQKQIEYSPCEHPMCDQLHRRFMQPTIHGGSFHETKTTWWIVVDTQTGMQAHNAKSQKECKQMADRLNVQVGA